MAGLFFLLAMTAVMTMMTAVMVHLRTCGSDRSSEKNEG